MNDENVLPYAEKLLREGRANEARALLAGYIQRQPASAQGWLLLSMTVTDKKQQADCLERVLKFDPANSSARVRLQKLKGTTTETPSRPIPQPTSRPSIESLRPSNAMFSVPNEESDQPDESYPSFRTASQSSIESLRPVSIGESNAFPKQKLPQTAPFTSAPYPDSQQSSIDFFRDLNPSSDSASAVQRPVRQAAAKRKPAKKMNWIIPVTAIAVVLCAATGALGLIFLSNSQGGLFSVGAQSNPTPAPINLQNVSPLGTMTFTPTVTMIPLNKTESIVTPFPTYTPASAPLIDTPTSPPTFAVEEKTGLSKGLFPPNFSLKNIDGGQTSLKDYRGQVVLVFFWATWCQFCKAEMPTLQMAYDSYHDSGFVILGIDVGEGAGDARGYRDAHHLTFPILVDPRMRVSSDYNVSGFPTHYFIDKTGRIASVTIGKMDPSSVNFIVRALLNMP